MSGTIADPEAAQAAQRAFGTVQPQGTISDPEAAQAAQLSFPSAYAQSGLPSSFAPYAQAQVGQESSYGKADPANPLQITAATAAQPGYGVPPLDPRVLTDPKQGQANLAWGLRYEAARAKAAGLDPSTPAGAQAVLGTYNGGGDPNYVKHVMARMGQSPATSSASYAYNPAPPPPGGDSSAPAQQPQQAPQQPAQLAFTPPPMPLSLQQSLNQTGGFGATAGSRGLYALAGGLLTGRTLGQGLGQGFQAVDQQRQDDQRNALQAYTLENQQALYGLNAQHYAGQLGIQQQNATTKAGALDERTTNDAGKLGLAGGKLDETTQHDRATENLGAGRNVIGGINAAAHTTAADAAAQQAGSTVTPPPAPIPGIGMNPVGPGAGAPPQPPPAPQQPPQAPQQPPQAPSTGPAGLPPGALQPNVPQQSPQAPAGGPSAPLPPSPTGQPPQAAPGAPTGLPGVGAAGLPSAGSNLTTLVGTRAQNAQRIANNRATAKESDEDTGIIETAQKQNTLLDDQLSTMGNLPWYAQPGTAFGRIGATIGSALGNQTIGDVVKNNAQLSLANLPHGVGALRIPEIKAAGAIAPGMSTPLATAQHIRDQMEAQNGETSDVLQARQAWIAGHPGESAAVGFDPIGNDYFRTYPAYSEQGGKAAPNQRPSVAEFARQHVDPSGRYVGLGDTEVQQASARAFPGTPQGPTSGSAAPPNGNAQSVGASSTSLPSLAPNQKAWLLNEIHNTPGFRDKFVQQYGQAALGTLN